MTKLTLIMLLNFPECQSNKVYLGSFSLAYENNEKLNNFTEAGTNSDVIMK